MKKYNLLFEDSLKAKFQTFQIYLKFIILSSQLIYKVQQKFQM
jgi:hypothetical protein